MDTLHSKNCPVLGFGFCKVLSAGKILRRYCACANHEHRTFCQASRAPSHAALLAPLSWYVKKLNTCPSIVCAVRLVLGGSYLQTLAARWLRVRTMQGL